MVVECFVVLSANMVAHFCLAPGGVQSAKFRAAWHGAESVALLKNVGIPKMTFSHGSHVTVKELAGRHRTFSLQQVTISARRPNERGRPILK